MAQPNEAPTGIESLVCDDIASRQALGIRKYGVTVAENPIPLFGWLQHSYQERLDDVIYMRRAMTELDALAEKIAADLFRNGNGDQAERLLLWQDSGKRELGGLCYSAVVDRIRKHLLGES